MEGKVIRAQNIRYLVVMVNRLQTEGVAPDEIYKRLVKRAHQMAGDRTARGYIEDVKRMVS